MSVRKSVLITGSGSGIGHALARAFQQEAGCEVFATDLNPDSLVEHEKRGMHVLELDVTSDDRVQRAGDTVPEMTGGKLDILMQVKASWSVRFKIEFPLPIYAALAVTAIDLEMVQIQKLYDINVFGAMRMVKAFFPLLKASGDARILETGSISAVTPYPLGSTYSSSKAALIAYGNAIRVELAPFNIKAVNGGDRYVEDSSQEKLDNYQSSSLGACAATS